MKILYCDHPQFAHGSFYLYEGLTRVLGADAVVDYPYKPVFHGRSFKLQDVKWYQRFAEEQRTGCGMPVWLPPFHPGEGLTYDNVQEIALAPFPGSSNLEGREYDEDEIVATINSFDLIVLANGHRVPTIALGRLKDKCKHLPPIIYYDEGELDEFNSHWVHTFRPALTFKKALTREAVAGYRGDYVDVRVPVLPLPLPLSNACTYLPAFEELQRAPISPREIDFTFHLGPTCPERHFVQERAQAVASREGMVTNTARSAFFFELLSKTRIALSMKGLGRETTRYWEIPVFGAAMLSDGTMGCTHPFPFEDGVTASFYRNLDEMEKKLVLLHHDEGFRSSIAKAGQEHARKYHSVEARALFFLAIVRERIGLSLTTDQDLKRVTWQAKLGWASELPEWRCNNPVGYETDLSLGGRVEGQH